ncbi:5-(carboxyamino)imidazole ribonucleotide synthase [Leptospira gomenensis]|uniref:N5-carboxyaminoimidazole ribonucleotide synthase n=1 Tax=Leptospira gomenensis TaxID=2484974 RepID=A0A5F1Y6Z1_9LEPT|nr:5-(carboxyamino)imidazole ribonucleotide synthase [Leptospira gomenensis]TGK29091.1 5-(carboxyamino)imidazole ribonucleotide synthase [Leptospira gomenensis]TGK40757.1 5-(carboxyamino)imidazole ribonucleotide synthase [Leptospira gomenensis]TGK42524.1 5-(carboxyamino)imidazole ribonucleotide synthase [Leptospira gomenensis]TGK68484.1 5-(carboxyamino)imidazole ribonucleotide synthase [Leptospira gomenensis]
MGSGQLARMFCLEAIPYGYEVQVYSPERNSPASAAGAKETVAEYEDENALNSFLRRINALTFEFENIPEIALSTIEKFSEKNGLPVHPSPNCIRIAQNRWKEKNTFVRAGIPTVNFYPVFEEKDKADVLSRTKYPCILKTNTMGYDGKGQIKCKNENELAQALSSLEKLDHIVEEFFPFSEEASVIFARFSDGEVSYFQPSKNVHTNHILDLTFHPGNFPEAVRKRLIEYARKLAETIDYVGVFGIEFFLKDGEILCNEFAPRPHNSGHFSQNAGTLTQFSLQLRTLCGLPVPKAEGLPTNKVVMKNILGEDYKPGSTLWNRALGNPHYHLHLYGKTEARNGRKMGHWNYNGPEPERAFSDWL